MGRVRPSVLPSVHPSIHSFILPSVRLLILLICPSPFYRADYFETSQDDARHGSAKALRVWFFHCSSFDPKMRSNFRIFNLDLYITSPTVFWNFFMLMKHICPLNPSHLHFLTAVMWPKNDVNAENIVIFSAFIMECTKLTLRGFWLAPDCTMVAYQIFRFRSYDPGMKSKFHNVEYSMEFKFIEWHHNRFLILVFVKQKWIRSF